MQTREEELQISYKNFLEWVTKKEDAVSKAYFSFMKDKNTKNKEWDT